MLVVEANEDNLDLLEKLPPQDNLTWKNVLKVFVVFLQSLLKECFCERKLIEHEL